jgi:hypothetical protein
MNTQLRIRTALRAGDITLYGTDTCSWTTKQRDYFDNRGVPYSYVNCKTQACPGFVTAYPTTVKDGQVFTGFQEL